MRECGILMHISSLPSRYGCGNLGAQARHFADFLNASGVKVWQMLPIHPTGFGNSPYQSLSLFAGNPYFIDPVALLEQGLLKQSELEDCRCGRVDYCMLFNTRLALFKTAYDRAGRPRFEEFVMQRPWLWDYALFMALKAHYGFAGLGDWPRDIRAREAAAMSQIIPLIEDDAWFYVFLQKLFFEQWRGFKAYANNRGIKLLGDMSIYAASDSADVWSQPELFQLDAKLEPSAVAGVPPDYFSPKGQLWGNPLYDWPVHRQTGYSWWIERMKTMLELFDMVRIDHFRGFESYYSVPSRARDATLGRWEKGPGRELFDAIEESLGHVDIIAEDLGIITKEVKALLNELGYPGMRVLQFAFDSDASNPHLPHNHIQNAVVYTGTHDNDTLAGFAAGLSPEQQAHITAYIGSEPYEGLMRAALGSVCRLCILPMQDVLELGSSARMNTPASAEGNWSWQMDFDAATPEIAARLLKLNRLYGRA